MTLDTISFGAALVLLVPALVFCGQCVLSLLTPRRNKFRNASRPDVAVVIPAHDEAMVIEGTVKALLKELDATDRLIVVADNCTDDTAQRAAAAGAEVMERTDAERRGKGFTLAFAVDALRDTPPPVVLFIDADCRVSEGAIDHLARAANALGRPVQADFLMTPADDHPRAAVSALAFLVRNRVRPMGLHRIGLPCHLTGSGMAFPFDIIERAPRTEGWIVEDLLLGIETALQGAPAYYCSDARVTSVLADRGKAETSQRTRWEHGQLATMLKYGPRLMIKGVLKMSAGLIALALDLMVPPLAFFLLILGFVTFLFTIFGVWAAAATTSAALGLVGLGVALAWSKHGRATLPASQLSSVVGYVFWKIPMYFSFVSRRREKQWVRTERSSRGVERLDEKQ